MDNERLRKENEKYHALGWWWADPIAALAVAVAVVAVAVAVAVAVEAWHTAPRHSSPG